MKSAAQAATVLAIGATLSACGFWNPFDHDGYIGQADAVVTADGQEYRARWKVSISRESSFNPYSETGRQDGWRFEWGGTAVTLKDGTHLWIDASKAVPVGEEARLLGITGAQPVRRPPRSTDMLGPDRPLVVEAPVYVSATGDRPETLQPYRGPCGSGRTEGGCWATVRFTVPHDYVGPYDRNPANYIDRLPK